MLQSEFEERGLIDDELEAHHENFHVHSLDTVRKHSLANWQRDAASDGSQSNVYA